MKSNKHIYRKNFSLIIVFLVLISVTFVIALFVSYNLNARYVENEFASKKIDVLEQTIKPYNDLFQNKIPEITSYQGFLDSASAARYADVVFHDYSFVKVVLFYDARIGNQRKSAINVNHLGISVNALYRFIPKDGEVSGLRILNSDEMDFKQMALKLSRYISYSDTTRSSTQDEIYKTFYDVKPGKISYSNILRREDVKTFRELEKQGNPSSFYKQNMMTFLLDPYLLKVKNSHKELYQSISIQPVVYDPIDNQNDDLITEVAFPGAFSDYKLFFRSARGYLTAEINRRFAPIGAMVLLIYCFLVLIGWLIYRNLSVNLKMFKLQYDFINNFTHEFKTPVSVIKIAGSNLSGDNELSERQRKQYGRILNEEADKLNELMNKLLSFTQLENRSIHIKREEIDVKDFASKYIETFKLKYTDFKIVLKVNDVKTFYTDPVLLGSVFQNLIENAYKYSHPNKKELLINISHEKRNIIFSFADKGIGIQKGELNNIFKKFYRIENKYNQNGSVGLGLAFCKELVNFMNGEIIVNSRENEGSEFVVTLPYEN
ncbi:two-component system phosphate regulon sensor histidine kinase PhoR [Mucilaginibacter frigoritolerans]|jgi:two-component system, OmpR family, phosphate regulon sensor histidine kinase PhoR|uniref:histidine kinase n=1 Tax=Mucilaginibacter frigoritolerans TaxID=652788 RepID=A0A562U3V2_9SPHI|nr:HAMP domain-containing sensor histidine kinase [Mucilaginibacter frigoritolerans]TWJ00065.1 two-component system phosphate regulon sensor histidine kinase PhoR [Mucilaginibacter frigoritolerans]